MDSSHEVEPGEVCPECGTRHESVESLPKRPLTQKDVKSLRESEKVDFARGVGWWSGILLGFESDKEATENLVLSTDESTRLISFRDNHGWIVYLDVEHRDNEDPSDVGQDVWMDASQRYSEIFHSVFDDIIGGG